MTPRTEVHFLERRMTASRAAKQVADSSWSRYPVAGRDEDDVVGFVHVRDLFLPDHPAGRAATVGDLAREVKRLPGTAGCSPRCRDAPGEPALRDRRRRVRRHRRHRHPRGPHRGGHRRHLRRVRRGRHRRLRRSRPSGPHEVDGLWNLDDFAEATGLRAAGGALRDGRRLRARRARPAAGGGRHGDGRGPHAHRAGARRTADRPDLGQRRPPARGRPGRRPRGDPAAG